MPLTAKLPAHFILFLHPLQGVPLLSLLPTEKIRLTYLPHKYDYLAPLFPVKFNFDYTFTLHYRQYVSRIFYNNIVHK